MAKDFGRLSLQKLRADLVESKGLIRLAPFAGPWSMFSKGLASSNSDLRAAMNALVSAYSRQKPRKERIAIKLQGLRRLKLFVGAV